MATVIILALAAMTPACNMALGNKGLTLYGSEPATLDPALCTDATSASYIVEIFSGLVTLDNDLEVIPDIAQSWDISPDLKTYTFHLRDGVRFHNGKPVTASDFKYSIERAADPRTRSPVAEAYLGDIVGIKEKLRGEADEVSGVRVIDDKTLQITIDAPKAYFLSKLTYPTAFVVDQANVESSANWWQHPNGTGPFKLGEWREGQWIILERNEHFYREVAKLERVTFRLTGNSMMMYERGEIDITQVDTANIERVLDPTNPLNKELVDAPELSVWYIGFNTAMPPFDDEKVRQAFCHAVDKDKIIEILLKDIVSRADGILPPGMPGYNEELEGLTYDVERAQQLIAESSYSDGLPPIVLSSPGSCAGVSSVDIAIASMWQENIGVEVEIEAVEWETFLDDLREGRFQTFEVGWIADYPDPENFLDLLFHSESVENHTAYSNPDVDELLEAARVEGDVGARLEIYQEVEQIIVDEAPWLPLWFGKSYFLVKPYVKGFSPAPMIIPTFKDVWIEE
ncbi:MAG: peptide ABC transporter substrate-binding protein [Dehalococcoidia bacterium]|nr:peptide ABC transporter substrate-binding protein [Dehalococcoidia bacterium]